MSPIDLISSTSLRENVAKVMDEVCDAGSYVVSPGRTPARS